MIESVELVRLAMEAIGSDRPSDLAKRLGLTAYGSPRRVTRWLSEENEPDYQSTMKLLELVGALNMGALTIDRLGSEPAAEAGKELRRAGRARDLEKQVDRAARPRRETG